jgi:hypothetical protein
MVIFENSYLAIDFGLVRSTRQPDFIDFKAYFTYYSPVPNLGLCLASI